MDYRRILVTALIIGAIILLAFSAGATTFIVPDDRTFIDQSKAIVVATAVSSRCELDSHHMIVTVNRVTVSDTLKGSVSGTIDVVTPGGAVGKIGLEIPGVPAFHAGQKSLLFLVKDPDGRWRLNSWALAKFDFRTRSDGTRILVRGVDSGGLFGFDTGTMAPHQERVRNAEGFIEFVRETALGLQPTNDYFTSDDYQAQVKSLPAPIETNGVAKTPYLMPANNLSPSYGIRRTDDPNNPSSLASGAVNFLLGSGGGSVAPANGTTAVDTALAAWTNDPDSQVTMARTGTTPDSTLDTSTQDFKNEIILGMNALPFFETGNTVGLCYNWYNTYDYQHTSPTEYFYRIVESDIGVKTGSYSQQLLNDILTHEAGHALGIRHSNAGSPSSNAAIMYPSVSGAYNGVLQTWDLDAVDSVYGNGPVCHAPVLDPNTPLDKSISYGSSTTLSANISGTSPFHFQWYKMTAPVGVPATPVGSDNGNYNTGSLTQTTYYKVEYWSDCDTNHQTSRTAIVNVGTCVSPNIGTQPQSSTIESGQSALLTVSVTGSTVLHYQWYKGASGDTSTPIAGAYGSSYNTGPLTTTSSYWVQVSNDCGTVNSDTATLTIPDTCEPVSIGTQPASQTISPGESVTLSVGVAGTEPFTYQWYQGASGDTSNPVADETSASYTTPALDSTTSYWVQVSNDCGTADSDTATLTVEVVCHTPAKPVIAVSSAQALTGTLYTVSWDEQSGVSTYQLDESTTSDFSSITPRVVTGQSISISKIVSTPKRYYYRVRAVADCDSSVSQNSLTASVVVVLPPPADSPNPDGTAPFGSSDPVTFQIFIPGDLGASVTAQSTEFTATSSEDWLTLDPSSGNLPPDGTTITATAAPGSLSVGTNTASVTVTTTQSSSGRVATPKGSPILAVPVSVSLVTPVSPVGHTSPNTNSVIVPQVAHAAGYNSQWQSDLRVLNNLLTTQKLGVFYTPQGPGGYAATQKTTMNLNGGQSAALNDILKNWYAQGSTGESVKGSIEIRPPATTNKTSGLQLASPVIASSRTFNITTNGTYGLFMPAFQYSSFVPRDLPGGGTSALSLQQISQSADYRTNIGLIEASGQPATGTMLVYDGTGSQIGSIPFSLAPSENIQLDGILYQNGITASNARVELHLTSDTGRIQAYAAIVDNHSQDPILVPASNLADTNGTRWVLPAIADIQTGAADWRSDVRIFNAGDAPVNATLTFYPQLDPSSSKSINVTLNPGEVKALDGVLRNDFGLQNTGGSLAISTASESSIVATARTYNQLPDNGGTYGQFVPASTPQSARGMGDLPLKILQLEQSPRFRTNLGLTEVTGQSVTVKLTATAPGLLASPSFFWTLSGNEFLQFTNILNSYFGLGSDVYNATVSVQVVGGNGKVSAYGSVVDNSTQDPTYVPAQ